MTMGEKDFSPSPSSPLPSRERLIGRDGFLWSGTADLLKAKIVWHTSYNERQAVFVAGENFTP
jgi:hypothetical protein